MASGPPPSVQTPAKTMEPVYYKGPSKINRSIPSEVEEKEEMRLKQKIEGPDKENLKVTRENTGGYFCCDYFLFVVPYRVYGVATTCAIVMVLFSVDMVVFGAVVIAKIWTTIIDNKAWKDCLIAVCLKLGSSLIITITSFFTMEAHETSNTTQHVLIKRYHTMRILLWLILSTVCFVAQLLGVGILMANGLGFNILKREVWDLKAESLPSMSRGQVQVLTVLAVTFISEWFVTSYFWLNVWHLFNLVAAEKKARLDILGMMLRKAIQDEELAKLEASELKADKILRTAVDIEMRIIQEERDIIADEVKVEHAVQRQFEEEPPVVFEERLEAEHEEDRHTSVDSLSYMRTVGTPKLGGHAEMRTTPLSRRGSDQLVTGDAGIAYHMAYIPGPFK